MPTQIEDLVSASLGRIPLSLLVRNAQVLNVFTGEILRSSIGIFKDTIVFVGSEAPAQKVEKIIDARGAFAIPGLIDTHLHIESTMMIPTRFAEAVLTRGTTTVCADPHEIVNVLGIKGLRMMLDNAKDLPMKIFFFVPTCVPESSAVTNGGTISPEDVEKSLDWKGVVGLGEVMDYDAVLASKPRLMKILEIGRRRNSVIDGHSPLLSGAKLSAYISTGPEADHENFSVENTIEKLRNGMYVKLRGPDVLDTRAFVAAIKKLPSPWNAILVTDDVMPDRLESQGHLDNVCRSVIASGMDPVEAVRSATLRPAQHMRMSHLGAIAPGKLADIVLLKSLKNFVPETVISNGRLVAKGAKLLDPIRQRPFAKSAFHTIHIHKFKVEDFVASLPIKNGTVELNCIDFQPASSSASFLEMVLTKLKRSKVEVRNGKIITPGIASVIVFERHGKGGRRGHGFTRNLMTRGALASTIAHDAHNLMVIGTDPHDMLMASELVVRSRGGVVAVKGGRVLARIKLPIAGLMCEKPLQFVANEMRRLREAFKKMGMIDHLYMPIPFLLSLSVIPHARITDKGTFDVDKQEFVSPSLRPGTS
ncbi:MAG TPA: adenine deaminase C-terminal domain-containing protein [Nitrososphaerales archaeon]|nr:adenine deaminase C-terminal domain-containing protein [Nitrososphaerales archaeon]